MTRTTVLFLFLLIGSCLVTVNARHYSRTLITEKEILQEKVSTLNEKIRRLELEKARLAGKETDPDDKPQGEPAASRKCSIASVTNTDAGPPVKTTTADLPYPGKLSSEKLGLNKKNTIISQHDD